MQRRAEVAGIRWSEISDDLGVWTVPGSRMKNGRPHDVHLSDAAREILRSIPRIDGCDFVFSTTGRTPISGLSKAKVTLDAAIMKARGDAAEKAERKPTPLVAWRIHDLRRTGVTKLAALDFDSIVADAAGSPAREAARRRRGLPTARFRARARSGARRLGSTRPRDRDQQRGASAGRLTPRCPTVIIGARVCCCAGCSPATAKRF